MPKKTAPAAADPLAEANRLIDALLARPPWALYELYNAKLEDAKAGKHMLALDRADQARLVAAVVPRLAELDRTADQFRSKPGTNLNGPAWEKIWHPRQVLHIALRGLLRRRLPLGEEP